MHDLVIRGGTVVDGTGAPARTADVAVDDGVVVEVGRVGGLTPSRARRRRRCSSRPGSSTCTRTSTVRPPGTRTSRRRAGTA